MGKSFVLKNALLEQGREATANGGARTLTAKKHIVINGGEFGEILDENAPLPEGMPVHDGRGLLVAPSFREMHCHLDKTLMGNGWQAVTKTSSVLERAENEKQIVPNIKTTTMGFRSRQLIDQMRRKGSTFIRTHVDIYPEVGTSQFDPVQEALASYGDSLDYEIVAFPQHGLLLKDCAGLLREALKKGADFVGGVDPTVIDGNMEKSLNLTVELAVEAGVGIDYHLHERGETGIKAINMLADLTAEAGLQNKVYISHGFSLRDIDGALRDELTKRLKSLGITLISHVPLNNAVPDLNYYFTQGLPIALGSDNIFDCWSPFGNGDMLERLNRFSEMFVRRTEGELSENLGLITGGITPLNKEGQYTWPKKGDMGSFVLADASCTAEMVARRSEIKEVYHKGNLVYGGN